MPYACFWFTKNSLYYSLGQKLVSNLFQKPSSNNLFKSSTLFWVVITNGLLIHLISLIIIRSCYVGTEGLVKYLPSCVPQVRCVSLNDFPLIWIFITCVLIVLNLIYMLCMLRNMIWFFWFWFVVSLLVLNDELNQYIRSMLDFVWLSFCCCFKNVFLGMYMCACFMHAYTYSRHAYFTCAH